MPPTSCRHQNALIAEATEHFDKGCAAIKAGDMEEAITLLAKALELRTEVYGEEDIQCASAYYKYGCALFYKAQDENTIFGKQGQAAVDKQDGGAPPAAGAGSAGDDEGEDCDDDDDDDGADDGADADEGKKGGKGKEPASGGDGDDDEDEEDEDDMELAWKLIENARLCYEEDGNHPIELANVYETLGEINTEHANFEASLEDLGKCLAILETELEEDDRRIAGVLCSMSVAHQLLDDPEKALKGCTRAIGICTARVARLKSSDDEAIAAVCASASGVPGGAAKSEETKDRAVLLAAAKAEMEQIQAGLEDLKAREEELKGLVSEDASTRDQIKKAFAAIGGMGGMMGGAVGGGAAGAAGAGSSAGGAAAAAAAAAAAVESNGFAAPQLKTAAQVVTQTVRKKEPKRVAPMQQAAAPVAPAGSSAAAAAAAFSAMAPKSSRSLEDMMGDGGGSGNGGTTTTIGFGAQAAPAAPVAAAPAAAPVVAPAAPAVKKAKIAPVAATPGGEQKENAPNGCPQQ